MEPTPAEQEQLPQSVETHGWELINAVDEHSESPDAFELPEESVRGNRQAGHVVKLLFYLLADLTEVEEGEDLEDIDSLPLTCERMWVNILSREETGGEIVYTGNLQSEPQTSTVVHSGERVVFGPEHVSGVFDSPYDPLSPDYSPEPEWEGIVREGRNANEPFYHSMPLSFFINMLESDEPEKAFAPLSSIGDEGSAAIPSLMNYIRSERAMARITDQEDYEQLEEEQEDDPEDLVPLAMMAPTLMIAQMGSSTAVQSLAELLSTSVEKVNSADGNDVDQDVAICMAVIRALAHMGPEALLENDELLCLCCNSTSVPLKAMASVVKHGMDDFFAEEGAECAGQCCGAGSCHGA